MSSRNVQSDTSRVIVKNPLLSAVPGTIDDFVNNSILLPAAEIPVVPSPPLQAHDHLDPKDNRDATKSVIYGTEPPAALDSDKFSEISLDQPVDAEITTSQPQEYNPLQNLDTFYPTAGEQQRDDNSFNPLAQATAIKESLSQLPGVLPGVASSVFSSFSSILKGRTSPHPSTDPSFPSQLHEHHENSLANQYQCFYDQSIHQQQQEVPPIVPTFYSPTDPNIQRPDASLSPSSADQSNNLYRLNVKKKFYAPIPGLNANQSNPVSLRQSPTQSIHTNPTPSPGLSQPAPAVASQNNSFSLTSFFSGAVDKVLPKPVESLANVANQEPINYNPQQFAAPVAHFYNSNQFGAPDTYQQVAQGSTEHFNQTPFVVSTAPPPANPIQNPPVNIPPPAAAIQTSFKLNPFQKPSTQQQQTSAAPAASSSPQIFNVGAASATSFAQPSTESQKTVEAIPVAQFFNPNQFNASSLQQPTPPSTEHFIQSTQSSINTPPLVQNPSLIQQPSIPASHFQQPPPPAVTPNSFNPSLFQNPSFSQQPSASTSPALVQQSAIPSSYLPPSAAPSTGQGVSYRLQGKPLYKKPVQASPFSNPPANSAAQFFNPSAAQSAISPPNFQIFNPLTIGSQQHIEQAPNPSIPTVSVAQISPVASSLPSDVPQIPQIPPVAQIQSAQLPSIQFPPAQILQQSESISEASLPDQITNQPTPESVATAVDARSAELTPAQIPSQAIQNNIVPPAVSVFNPFSQASSTFESSSVIQPQASPINFNQNYQATAPPLPENEILSNPFAVQSSASSSATKPQSSGPLQLNPFFGVVETQSTVIEPPVKQPIESEEEIVAEVVPSLKKVAQPAIQNFFESAPFDPFQQTKNNLSQDSLPIQTLNDRNANIKHIDTDIEDLTFDKENNISEESIVQPQIEAPVFTATEPSTFDPTSFFNNNLIESAPQDTLNVNEFQIPNYIFNEPPPLSEVQENVQEKNFNFIRTNLLNKRIERIANAETASPETLSIASIIAEPASSAQSEISCAEPASADVSQSLTESLQNNQDQSDGINIYSWLNKQEPPQMATTPIERTSTPTTSASTNIAYRPVYKHWFYKATSDSKKIWVPFTFTDSMLIEEAFLTNDKEVVTTDGGRFDVNIPQRTRTAVYWTAEVNEVRRCSWFYKGIDFRLIPYEEHVAEQLEEEYRDAAHTGEWRRKIPLTSGETVVFNGPSDILHFLQSQSADSWNDSLQTSTEVRPRAVKRGTDEFAIEDGEPEQIDHLLFMVHGIGSACDLKFRKVEEVVDEFRNIALQLVQSHYRSSCDQGIVGRVEVLPISWHSELHSEESGIDEKLKSITLESIPKLRNFTNDTLLDILFYTSPVFCQQIIDAVSGNMNKCYAKFCERNPDFHGSVSVSGHSLGSVILFDLLQHQRIEIENSENLNNSTRVKSPLKRLCSQQINYTIGQAGTGQPYITYPQLSFQPKHFFALGSPIGMFVTIRGIDALGLDFKLPTTEHFFNLFHPYDPVAYRIEALVNPELQIMRPVLVPHHKGRKRMHIELRETVARVGADIKQKILQTLKSTIDTVYSYTTLHKCQNDTKAITQEVNKVIDEQLHLDELETSANTSSASSEIDTGETDLALGKINGGRRIDYVLQEAPLECINEYLFALTSHVCYWGSEDATLFLMKEIYSSLGVQADTKIPQPTMTIERPSPANSVKSSPTTS